MIKLPDMPTFEAFFHALWGYPPFPWQTMLALKVAAGKWPRSIDLPTAAGKTACVDIGIYALAAQAERSLEARTMPRRIWFVVDRRIVVDETNDRAVLIADKLRRAEEGGPLRIVADRLRHLSGMQERPLATGRLRGGVLSDDGFARLPNMPAVITSTVDQLGSRLLFRSYGSSNLAASIHAGLAGNDSLILLDEAHLSIPFMQTLKRIELYRGEKWSRRAIPSPFAFTLLSATPPQDAEGGLTTAEVFPEDELRARALDHPLLHQRLGAAKPAELITLKKSEDRDATLVREASARAAACLALGKHRVALIVNRVRTAELLAQHLEEAQIALLKQGKARTADVVLLTGRFRPLERDTLIEKWKPCLAVKHERVAPPGGSVLFISTQCIEVGADFSFDAMITECASLDALRQRFGRLNRLGDPGESPAYILAREDNIKDSSDPDPIYAQALRKTWALMWSKSTEKGAGKNAVRTIDFGFAAMDTLLADLDAKQYLECVPPHIDAPVLLPAHLDLLCQTEPVPFPEPDISLYLHGPKRTEPEVRVLWRADLLRGDAAGNPKGDDIYKERTSEIAIKAYADAWPDLIALCPPRTAECVSVSLNAVKRWLRVQWGKTFYENAKHRNGGSQPDNATTVDDATDVEVTPASGDDDADNRSPTHPCLVWRGRKRSRLIGPAEADDIQPGDTVVLPVIDEDSLAGLAHSFLEAGNRQGLGAGIKDLYELSVLKSERPPMLRINRALWHDWVRTDARSVEAETAMPQLREARESVRALVDACCKDVDEPSPARAEIVDHIRQVVASWEALSPECESIAKALAERARPLPLPAVLPRWLVDLLRMFLDDSVATGHVDQVEVHPCGGIVVFAKQISSGEAEKREKEQDLFADEDDATSFSSKAVSLWDHTRAVIHSVDNFAKHCLPLELRQVVHDSALWHDVGKLDLRFQLILHNGDSRAVEAAHAKPLAKSNRIPLSKSRSAEIYGLAGLPKRFRHEMLSAQIAGKFGPLRADAIETALFLHLIASHHGYARPLAPISVDPPPQAVLADDPPAEVPGISTDRVVLPGIRFNFTEEERAGCLPLHHVASGVTDRFWTLTRHYGWWGLAYLEAIMRLGDWRGSYIPHEVTPSVSVESTVIPDSDRS